MNLNDIRWVQRFNNFNKALEQLTEAVELSRQRELSKLEKQGLIQSFEYTHELAWNTIKDFLLHHGTQNIYGSKDASREAFNKGLIQNGEVWMDMIISCNKTTHTYDEATVSEIVNTIINSYFPEFVALKHTLNKLKEKELV
ncbi:MAG: nucleotidyltransferase substrate binding protein [Candidatus Hydrogenedentota bacterium]